MRPDPVRLAILGCGNVGAALIELIGDRADAIEDRTGIRLEITRVVVRNASKDRGVDLAPGVLGTDAAAAIAADDVDLVVELIGGIEPARHLSLDALKSGKPVVSANKELVANVGEELYAAASSAGVDYLFEASVAGGIPLIRPLRESLVGEDIDRVMGIVNGTTNYILTRMTEAGADYHTALAEAQSLGFAERDPTADVEGFDAAAKAAIIATIAFGAHVVAGDVYREGISTIEASDIDFAKQMGYVIKLLAIAERSDDGQVAVRVHPTMVPHAHPLASVRESFNAVFIEGRAVGDLMFYGRGAGGEPTASAVLGDVIDAAVNLRMGTHATVGSFGPAKLRPIDDVSSAFYLSLTVADEPGVLATIASAFGRHGVSIRSMEQDLVQGVGARIVFITHTATESDVRATLAELRGLPVVTEVGSVMRVVGDEGE